MSVTRMLYADASMEARRHGSSYVRSGWAFYLTRPGQEPLIESGFERSRPHIEMMEFKAVLYGLRYTEPRSTVEIYSDSDAVHRLVIAVARDYPIIARTMECNREFRRQISILCEKRRRREQLQWTYRYDSALLHQFERLINKRRIFCSKVVGHEIVSRFRFSPHEMCDGLAVDARKTTPCVDKAYDQILRNAGIRK